MISPGMVTAGLGAISSLSNSFSGSSSSKKAMQQAMAMFRMQKEWEQEKMKNAHQWETEDLIKSNLNPALTATGSTAGSIAGAGTGTAGIFGSTLDSATQSNIKSADRQVNSALKTADIYNQYKQVASQIGVNEAEIENKNADTARTTLSNRLVEKYGDKQTKAELANTLLNNELTKANTGKAVAETNETIGKTNANAGEAEKGKQIGEFYKNHPLAAKILGGTTEILPIVKSIAGGAGVMSAAKRYDKLLDLQERRLNTTTETNYFNKLGEVTGGRHTRRRVTY